MIIVVGGYIVGYPLGGMTWHHLHYLLGLRELGHQIIFLEDSGDHCVPYNPAIQRCEIDSSYGRAYLQRTLREFRLPVRWCYYSSFEHRHFGMTRDELNEALRGADLMLCVSGVTPIRPDRPRPRRLAVIDTDPGFTQLRMARDPALLDYYRQFDVVASFGRLIGTEACQIPSHGFRWIGTHQPISLPDWPVVPVRSQRFTTVGKWQHSSERHVEFNDQHYFSSKSVEWMKLLDLPSRISGELILAMQSMPAEVQETFRRRGWTLADPERAAGDCAAFRRFVQDSVGELTVAKQIYSALPSGWFSDRSACYLASGRPVVTQSTGFESWLPTGEGLFSFTDCDSAAAALEQITSRYELHSQAAREIAERYFDARKVLSDLLEAVM